MSTFQATNIILNACINIHRLTNCDEANLLKTLVLPVDVDISQPLLFYKKYRPTKVLAKCLKAQKNGKWKETGPSVVIPDSFPGKKYIL